MWEYRMEKGETMFSVDRLNRLGEAKWELVAVATMNNGQVRGYFKRPVAQAVEVQDDWDDEIEDEDGW